MNDPLLPGVSAMSLYVPPFRVTLRDWCDWTGDNWNKVRAVVGDSFRICGRRENVYAMAANAALRLILKNAVDPRRSPFGGLAPSPARTTRPGP